MVPDFRSAFSHVDMQMFLEFRHFINTFKCILQTRSNTFPKYIPRTHFAQVVKVTMIEWQTDADE